MPVFLLAMYLQDGAAVLSAIAAYETANRCLQRGGLRFVLMLDRIGFPARATVTSFCLLTVKR